MVESTAPRSYSVTDSTMSQQVKLETTPTTMLCYDTQNMVTSQPIVTAQNTLPTAYTKDIVAQDNFLVTQDSTLTTTVKQVAYLL